MKVAVILAGMLVAIFPNFTAADTAILTNLGNFFAGESCRVPIFHTEFAFPPEGGQIVRDGDQLYFIKNYIPGCENAGAGSMPVPVRNVNQFPATNVITTSTATKPGQAVPKYSAPNTGCNN